MNQAKLDGVFAMQILLIGIHSPEFKYLNYMCVPVITGNYVNLALALVIDVQVLTEFTALTLKFIKSLTYSAKGTL